MTDIGPIELLFIFLLFNLAPRLGIDIHDHAVEQLAQVIVLVQIAGIAGEMPQVLRVAQALPQDHPRVWRHAIVYQFKGDQQTVSADLL